MARSGLRCFLLFPMVLTSVIWADDKIYFPDEAEKLKNTPPELTSNPVGQSNDAVQSRFLPFSASFSLGADSKNAHSVSIGGTKDGISLSQSTSLADSGSNSASQSSSFAAGLSGIAASDSKAFSSKNPIFGDIARADSNSYSLGEASASSEGKVVNGQAQSGAQSSVGSSDSLVSSGASSSAGNGEASADAKATATQKERIIDRLRPSWLIRPNYQSHRRAPPTIHVQLGQKPSKSVNPESNLQVGVTRFNPHEDSWQSGRPDVIVSKWRPNRERPWRDVNCDRSGRFSIRNIGCGGKINFFPENLALLSQNQHLPPNGTKISTASASSSASSSSNGFSFSQSSSQSHVGPNGPSSSTNNHVQTSGNGQSYAQGAAAGVQQNSFDETQASFSSGTISGSSQGNGQSIGTASSDNRGDSSRGQVNSASNDAGSVQGTANSGSVSFQESPENNSDQDIPREFLRSLPDNENDDSNSKEQKKKDPVNKLLTRVSDTVADLFHF